MTVHCNACSLYMTNGFCAHLNADDVIRKRVEQIEKQAAKIRGEVA